MSLCVSFMGGNAIPLLEPTKAHKLATFGCYRVLHKLGGERGKKDKVILMIAGMLGGQSAIC